MTASHPELAISGILWAARSRLSANDRLRTLFISGIRQEMVSRTQMTLVLAGAVFLAACAYVGYINELLNDAVAPVHRVILLVGFILGAGCVSRWLMAQDLKRNLERIKRARSNRGKVN